MRITGGEARGLRLVVPRLPRIRPTSDRVRGALFQLVGPLVAGARVLDLYAGSGSLGIEALSRGAVAADFIEQNFRLCEAIKRNLETTGYSTIGHVYRANVEKALTILDGPYHLVLLDPPYYLQELPSTMEALNRKGLLDKQAIVVTEHSIRTPLAGQYGRLSREDLRHYGDTALSLYGIEEP
ncbi:16S rRNA (guanine(966)-N(2))-methyltransferase RsmD [Dehalococcoidia bacterium]|nr:16S rRNA (guanine(966)-N(2))-methyltransferase RsmD [Dehalococcoidia bacterium]